MIDQVQFKDLTHEELSDINGGGLPFLLAFGYGFSTAYIGTTKLIDAVHRNMTRKW